MESDELRSQAPRSETSIQLSAKLKRVCRNWQYFLSMHGAMWLCGRASSQAEGVHLPDWEQAQDCTDEAESTCFMLFMLSEEANEWDSDTAVLLFLY